LKSVTSAGITASMSLSCNRAIMVIIDEVSTTSLGTERAQAEGCDLLNKGGGRPRRSDGGRFHAQKFWAGHQNRTGMNATLRRAISSSSPFA
jgi:hypothetical protein